MLVVAVRWLQQQRWWRGRGGLSPERRARLESLPEFSWPRESPQEQDRLMRAAGVHGG